MGVNKYNRRTILIIQSILFVVLVVSLFFFVKLSIPEREAVVRVDFLDIGQGASTHIRTPSGKDFIIDLGPDAKILEELSAVMPWYKRRIDGVFITHPDKDHMGGIFDVLDYYRVLAIYDNGFSPNTQTSYFYDAKIQKDDRLERLNGFDRDTYILDDDYNVYLRRISPLNVTEIVKNQ